MILKQKGKITYMSGVQIMSIDETSGIFLCDRISAMISLILNLS